MKTMQRNKSVFWYALYSGSEEIEDEWGNLTGETTIVYDDPLEYAGNISAAQGESSTRQFGESIGYDKVIVMDNDAPDIDEYSVLWVDSTPELDDDGALAVDDDGETVTPYDYIVKKVARSLNSVSIAISKVDVSG